LRTGASVRNRTEQRSCVCDCSPMTATLSSDFDEFLFASIGEDSSGAPVSVLTVLARLDVDAWEEAATLANMPRESAAHRLATLLASLPDSPAPAESATIAARLVALLHRKKPPPPRPGAAIPPGDAPVLPDKSDPALYYLLGMLTVTGLIFFVIWKWAATGPARPVPPVPALHFHV
jgi:hypothetical protein